MRGDELREPNAGGWHLTYSEPYGVASRWMLPQSPLRAEIFLASNICLGLKLINRRLEQEEKPPSPETMLTAS